MRIDFLPDDGTGRAVLQAIPELGDRTPPVDSLILDAAPTEWGADLAAAAGTLLFADFARGDLTFAADISHELTEAIYEATGRRVISPTVRPQSAPVDAAAMPDTPLRVTTLTVSLARSVPASTPAVDRALLALVPGERFQGALYGIKEAVIASNAWYLATAVDPTSVLQAVGILFSRDLLAGEVRAELADGTAGQPSPLAQQLAAAVGLTLS